MIQLNRRKKCPRGDGFVIKPFLELHKAEVKGMLLTEYKEAEAMKAVEGEENVYTFVMPWCDPVEGIEISANFVPAK